MLRFVILVIALALYGAYSLVGSLAGSTHSERAQTSDVQTETESSSFGFGSATDMAISAAASAANIKFEAMPSQGCSDSVLSPTKVEELVLSLPEPQKTALASVLNASSHVWTAQLYKGEKGVGLCLPVNSKLIVLPVGVSAAVDQVSAVVPSVTDSLSLSKVTP